MEIKELISAMQDKYSTETFPIMLESLRRKIAKGMIPGVTEADLEEALKDPETKPEEEALVEEAPYDNGLLLEEIYETEQFLKAYDKLYGEKEVLTESQSEPLPQAKEEESLMETKTLEELLRGDYA